MEDKIMVFCDEIINGSGGLKAYEHYEVATPNCDRDVAVAAWVIRCLANPENKNSQMVLDAILAQRKVAK